MARIAFSMCGFGPVDDPRSFLPPVANPLNPLAFPSGFQKDKDFAFLAVWRFVVIKYQFTVDWGDGVSSAAIDASGTLVAGWVPGSSTGNERSIRCQNVIDYAVTVFNGAVFPSEFILIMQLGDYDPVAEKFNFGLSTSSGFSASAQPSPTVSFEPNGPASGVDCHIFGEFVPMYDVVGSSSGQVIIDIADTDTYWPYDNGKTPPPVSNGPIWDKDNGDQLLSPIPRGL